MWISVGHLRQEERRCRQLLAVSRLRADVVSGAAEQHRRAAVAAMSGAARRETGRERTMRERTMRELHELIAALDRRVPQIERAGEVAIARASAELRVAALRRIEELGREVTNAHPIRST
jgi:hypothetical protein